MISHSRPLRFIIDGSLPGLLAISLCLGSVALAQDCGPECMEVLATNHYDVIDEALKPRWRATAGVLAMDRVTDGSLSLIQDTTNAAAQINADDFNFDWNVGYDVSLTQTSWDDRSWEIRFMDLETLDARADTSIANSLVNINGTTPVQAPGVQSIESRFDTDLFGLEFNYHHPLYERFHAMIGLRFVSLDDDLSATLNAAPQTFALRTSTRNDLYGVQIGLTSLPRPLGFPWLLFSGFAKAGLFENDAQHESLIDTSAAVLAIDQDTDNESFVGELGLDLLIPVGRQIEINAGYQLLWLENITVAGDQIPASSFFTGTGGNDRGQAIFHGARLSLSWRR